MSQLPSIPIDPSIPCGELWDSLPIAARDLVRRRMSAFEVVAQARNKGRARVEAALVLGMSEGWVRSLYGPWLKSGRDWRLLVDGRGKAMRSRARSGVNNPEFVTYWTELALSYQRKTAPAYQELCRRWMAGDHIPGYDGVYDRRKLPKGWSEPNLRRKLPGKRELALVRDGRGADYAHLPQVFKTRAGAWPMAVISPDDVWMDHYVHFCGQTARPLQLGFNDYYTGMRLRSGMKPRIKQANGSYMGLGKLDMLLLTAGLLYNVGYSARGTTIRVENGTATLNDREIALLERISRGRIHVEKAGITGREQLASYGYAGRGKGNPRDKAFLESWHNPYHNILSYLLGATGHNRTEPEGTYGIVKAEEALLKKLARCGDLVPQDIQHHLPGFYDYVRAADKAAYLMNSRTDHALEGWEECGFMVTQVRFSEAAAPVPLTELSRELVPLVGQLMQTSPHLVTTRRMSPQEAWDYAAAQPGNELIRISAVDVCDMLAQHMARPLRITAGSVFRVRDRQEYGDLDLLYECRVELADGRERELDPRGDYRGFVNPFDLSTLFVLDQSLAFVGTARLVQRSPIVDQERINAALGRRNTRTADILAPVRNVTRKRDLRRAEIEEHNKAVFETATPYAPLPGDDLPESYEPGTFN